MFQKLFLTAGIVLFVLFGIWGFVSPPAQADEARETAAFLQTPSPTPTASPTVSPTVSPSPDPTNPAPSPSPSASITPKP
ncbi:MAG TPA: hypothetical protein VIL74_06435 [Pyrinomonadaceae bacterium]